MRGDTLLWPEREGYLLFKWRLNWSGILGILQRVVWLLVLCFSLVYLVCFPVFEGEFSIKLGELHNTVAAPQLQSKSYTDVQCIPIHSQMTAMYALCVGFVLEYKPSAQKCSAHSKGLRKSEQTGRGARFLGIHALWMMMVIWTNYIYMSLCFNFLGQREISVHCDSVLQYININD